MKFRDLAIGNVNDDINFFFTLCESMDKFLVENDHDARSTKLSRSLPGSVFHRVHPFLPD